MSTVFSSLYRRRIPSGLLFVIHSINVCCLWDLLFAVILYSFFLVLLDSYVFVLVRLVLLFAISFQYVLLSHIVGSIVHAHMFCVCVQVVVRFAPPKHVPHCLSLYVCLCDCFVCVKFAQTLTIVPRVALNWYTVVFCLFLSQNFLWKTSVVFTYYKI